MIHAPSCAFVTATTIRTMPVTSAPVPLMAALVSPPGTAKLSPVHDHARLRQREGHEHADHVQRNQRVSVAAEDDEEDAGERAEAENAVREREPVALVHELPRKMAIAGQDRREPGKIRVRGIGRQHEDQHRRGLDEVVGDAAPLEDTARQLRDHGFVLTRVDLVRVRQQRDPEEHRDRQYRHDDHRRGGVAGFRRPEGRHAVGDGLHAGHGRAPVGERPQQQQQRKRLADRLHRFNRVDGYHPSSHGAPRSNGDERKHADDEEVSGSGEDIARLANPAKVAERQNRQKPQRQLDAQMNPVWKRRCERRDAGGDADRDGEDVVNQQRRGGDEARQLAEIFTRDDVRATAVGIRMQSSAGTRRRQSRESTR